MNLYKKILEVMKDVQYLQKDDTVSTGGTGSYKAISEEKVTETVRASLIKHGLIILPVEQEHLRDDTPVRTETTYNGKTTVKESVSRLSTVNTKYKIIDVDTGDSEVIVSSGTGVDTQDKGVGKAMTYSYKYLLLRSLAIPTGEDPDKISSDTITDEQSGGKPPQQGNQSGAKPQGNTGQNNASGGKYPMTPKQKDAINKLCGVKHINEEQGVALIQEKFKKTKLDDLSSAEASSFIQYLQSA